MQSWLDMRRPVAFCYNNLTLILSLCCRRFQAGPTRVYLLETVFCVLFMYYVLFVPCLWIVVRSLLFKMFIFFFFFLLCLDCILHDKIYGMHSDLMILIFIV